MNAIDLFISHSSADAEVARALRLELEGAGYSVWLAPDDVVGTDPWAEQILDAIEKSRAMLVLVSSNSNRSPHVSREVSLAAGRDRAIVPIRIENVAIEGALAYHLEGLQRFDAFPPPISDHREQLVRRLAKVIAPDSRTGAVKAGLAAAAVMVPARSVLQPTDVRRAAASRLHW